MRRVRCRRRSSLRNLARNGSRCRIRSRSRITRSNLRRSWSRNVNKWEQDQGY